MDVSPTVGLVLTGGGARGAYQAGVLRFIAERLGPGAPLPFRVVTGVSAGAINAAYLAARADDFHAATGRLWDVWAGLELADVFVTNALALSRIGAHLIAELSLGGLVRGPRTNHLLDTAPLRRLLDDGLDMPAIRSRLDEGSLAALALTATNYATGTAVTFFDGAKGVEPWLRSARVSTRARLTTAHVMASCALPVFFPPVPVAGSYYGDGCIRLTTPLSAAIHLGSDRVLAVGVRHPAHPDRTRRLHEAATLAQQPPLAKIGGVLLNAVFLDSLDTDVERAQRINQTLSLISAKRRATQPLRPLPLAVVRPSRELGTLTSELLRSFSPAVRHLLRGLGATKDTGRDLMSYLAFESSYTARLLRLGFKDASAQSADLDALFSRGG